MISLVKHQPRVGFFGCLLIIFLFGITFSVPTANAQSVVNLAEQQVPVAVHKVRRSITKFSFDKAKKPAGNEGYSFIHWSGVRAEQEESNSEEQLTVIDKCEASKVHRVEVDSAVPEGFFPEVLYYSAYDPNQIKQAKDWEGFKYAFANLDRNSPNYDSSAAPKLYLYAFMSEIRCIPTHFQHVKEGNRYFKVYREGEEAWKR